MNTAGGRSTITAKVMKAMGIFTGVQSVTMLCSILRAKLIALWIGPVGVGLFAIFNSVVDMISTASQLNMRQSAVRDISASPEARIPRIAGTVRWWTRRLGLLGAVLMLALSPLLSEISFGDTGRWWAFALLSAAVLAMAAVAGEQALLQGTGRLRILARSTIAGAVGGTLLSVPLYYYLGEKGIVPSIIVFAVASAVAVTAMQDVPSVRNSRRENIDTGKGFLKLGVYLTITSISTTIASYVLISYINNTTGGADTGLYQAGYTIMVQYTGVFFTALSVEFFPRVSAVADRAGMASVVVSHEVALMMYLMMPLVAIFIAADELAVRILYTDEFMGMLPFMTIGVVSMVFKALSWCMAFVIIGRGDGRTYVVTELLSIAICLTLNISMYRHWSFAGLGVSYIIWYALYTAIVGYVYRWRYGMRLSRGAVLASVLATATASATLAAKMVDIRATAIPIIAAMAISVYGFMRISRK